MQILGLLRYHLRIAIGVNRHICAVRRKDASFAVITMDGASIHQGWLPRRLVRQVETMAHREG